MKRRRRRVAVHNLSDYHKDSVAGRSPDGRTGAVVTLGKGATQDMANEFSYRIPFTSKSSLAAGLHVSASLGGGAPHTFLVDTGSVGILTPRKTLGPDFQDFDPSRDITLQYVSSGNLYHGQWVKVPVVLGVPAHWDGTGDYPTAHVEVFAVDRPADFDGGVMGIGFAIGGKADGGSARNPLLHLTYQRKRLGPGYIVSTQGIDAGLTTSNQEGFAFIALDRNASGNDWQQPIGSVDLTGDFDADGFSADLPFLMDTGIPNMILWVSADDTPPNLPSHQPFPDGISVSISAPAEDQATEFALQYSFVTGDASQSMAPSKIEWRSGNGLNTGRNVLAGADYLYDATAGRIGFRVI
jgi:hypothetical protein